MQLQATRWRGELLQPPLLPVLLRLLQLERQSCKWYPTAGARSYFQGLGDECAAAGAPPAPPAQQQEATPPPEQDEPPPTKRARAVPLLVALHMYSSE